MNNEMCAVSRKIDLLISYDHTPFILSEAREGGGGGTVVKRVPISRFPNQVPPSSDIGITVTPK